MASSYDRERLRAKLLAKGIQWDDEQLNSFIDSQQSVNTSIDRSSEGYRQLPSSRIVGPRQDEEEPEKYDLRWGRPQVEPQPTIEPRNAALDFLGNALWEFMDVSTFGALGYADEALVEGQLEEFLAGEEGPTGFPGRAGAGIGGLAGFIGPFGAIKGAAGMAVKGASKWGTKAAGREMLKEASKKGTLGGMKSFEKLAQSEKDKIFKPFVETLEQNAASGALHSSKGREAFTQLFNKNYKVMLKESLGKAGVDVRSADKLKAIEDIVMRNMTKFKGGNLPITTLQQHIAMSLGGSAGAGRIANIASHALEEAIVFAAVETPMELFNSLEEKRPTDFTGTIGHAFTLGSALGLIRMIPGGKGQGIVREGWRRLMGHTDEMGNVTRGILSNKRPFSQYDVANATDRKNLVKYVQSLWKTGNAGAIFRDKGLTKVDEKDIGFFAGTMDDIAKLGETAEGASTLKKVMASVENDWNKIWAKEWITEAGKDIVGSTPRMLAGAMAFNHDIIFDERVPLEDRIFNVLVGAFMTKSGRTVEYTGKDGKLKTIQFTERDFTYGSKIRDAAQYLDKLGMSHKSLRFQQLVNDYRLKEDYFSIDESDPDIKRLVEILRKENLIVPQEYQRGRKLSKKDQGTAGYHPLYEHLMYLADGPLTGQHERMLRPDEVTKTKMAKLEKLLGDTEFSNSDSGVIVNKGDVDAIMFKAADPKLRQMFEVYHNFVKQAYEHMGGTWEVGPDGSVEVFSLKPMPGVGDKISAADWDTFNNSYQRALNVLGRVGKGDLRVTVNPSSKNFHEVTAEGFTGLKDIATRLEQQANTLIYKDGPPVEGGVQLGEEMLSTWMEHQSYYKGVRDIYDKLTDIKNEAGTWAENPADAEKINKLIQEIFITKQGIVANKIELTDTPSDAPELELFVDALRQVIGSHPNYKAPFGLLSKTKFQGVESSSVRELRKILTKNGMGGFAVNEAQGLERFVHDIKRYTLDKQLSKARDSEGNLLNDIQRSKIKYMQESGIVDGQFNILNIKGLVDGLKAIGIPSSRSSQYRLEHNLGLEDVPVEGLYMGSRGLYETVDLGPALRDAARKNDMEPVEYAAKIIKSFEEHVEPLMKSGEGKGLLTPSGTEAQIDGAYLSEMVQRMEMIDIGAERLSHQALIREVEILRSQGEPNSEVRKFTEMIYHRFWNRQRDTRQVLNILAESGLWNRPKNALDLDAPKDPIAAMQDAMKKIDRLIPFSDTASRVEQRLHEYMDEHNLKYDHADDFRIMTPNEYKDNYGVDYEEIRTVFDNDKDLDPMGTVLSQIRKDGKEYKDFTIEDKKKAVMNTISIYRNHVNTANIPRIMAGEGVGAIVDTDHTFTKNSLFTAIEGIVGEGNFSIVDYNTMTGAGVIDSRRDINTERFLRSVLYDTNIGLNQDLKQNADMLGARITPLHNSVLVTLPESTWGIAIPRTYLSELSKQFVEVTNKAKAKYGKEVYGNAYKKIEQLTGRKINIDKKGSVEEDKIIYHVDEGVTMMTDPRIIEGDGEPRDVWIVKDLEAAQRQLMNMKDGLGGAKNFADTIDAHEGHHILRDKKILKDGTERGDHKYIYVEGDPNIPDGLKPDPQGREPGTDYIKTVVAEGINYKFKDSDAFQDGQYATEMLTHIWMDKRLGKNWWDILNETIDGKDPKAFTKLAVRFKLMSNVSMYGLDKKMADMTLKHLKDIDPDMDHVKGLEKLVDNDGMNIVIIHDEARMDGTETEGQKVFSAYENIKRQMEASLDNNITLKGRQDKEDLDWNNSKDASMVDSYMPVNKEVMRALEALAAAGDISGVGGIKPIIHKYAGADGRGVILGKTVFVYSKEFDPFFAKNENVHAIMFDSAEKMNDPTIQRLDLGVGETIESLMGKKIGENFINKLALEDIDLGAVVKPDHEATLSHQIANELSIIEGNSLSNWLVSDRMTEYVETVGRIFNEYDGSTATAYAKHHNNIPDTYDGLSSYSRWLKFNGPPTTSPYITTFKNNVKKVLIDDGGLLTMKNNHGSQSVLVPNLPFLDSSLRNTEFFKEDGSRKVYTYGQIEIGNNNRNKSIALERLHFIKHNSSTKDQLLTWEDFKKGDGKDLDIIDGMSLGNVYDAVSKIEGYEIAVTSYRNPKTRPGDIVISGLRGFLDAEVGNQARINAHDLKMRMEGDFDVDKVNYWWDTPGDLLSKWDSIAGEIGAVSGETNPTSLKGLGFMTPGSIEKFNKDQANAAYMRGKVVKTSRILQFLEHYTETSVSPEGVVSKVIMRAGNESGRIVVDADKMREARKILAEDIQIIVDSKNGYDTDLFKDDVWESNFLFGEKGNDRYQGVFSWEEYDGASKEWKVTPGPLDGQKYSVIAQEAIKSLIAPYRGLLQVGTGIFEDGKRRNIRYEDLIEASSNFEARMRYANKNAYKKLQKVTGVNKEDLDAVFKTPTGNDHNPFGDILSNVMGENLLPFEKIIRNIGKNDNMKVSVPRKMFGPQLDEFDRWSNEWIANAGEDSQRAIGNVINQIRSDSKNFGYLNYLDWRIKKQSGSMYEAKRSGNTHLAEAIANDVSRLTEKRKEIDSAMMTDRGVLQMLVNQAQRRITYEITSNWRYNKYTRDKKFSNYGEALRFVEENQGQIAKWAKAEPLKIKGISSAEQMDMIIWNEMLQKFKDIYIAPDFNKLEGQLSLDFEKSIYDFKKAYSKLWKQLFDDKKRRTNKQDPWLSENMIMEQAKGLFDKIYDQFEGEHTGLGRLAILKVMSPTKDIGSMTYFNGKFVESFRSDSPTYIKFGLRWLSNTDKLGEMVKDTFFKSFADSYSSLNRTLRGISAPAQDFAHSLYEESIKFNRESLYSSPAPLLDADLHMTWKTTKEAGKILDEINPDVAATFGYNQSFTTGYLLSSRLVGPEWIDFAKKASAYSYSPTGFIPNDYSGGKLPTIQGWDSFNNARYEEAKVFLGDALGKNILYAKFNPRVSASFDDAAGYGRQTSEDTRRVIKDRENDGECL